MEKRGRLNRRPLVYLLMQNIRLFVNAVSIAHIFRIFNNIFCICSVVMDTLITVSQFRSVFIDASTIAIFDAIAKIMGIVVESLIYSLLDIINRFVDTTASIF